MALGWSAAVALALTFVFAVLGTESAPSVFAGFAVALTYALAIGVPSSLVLIPMMTAVQSRHPLARAFAGIVAPAVICVPCSFIGTSLLVLAGLIPEVERWTRWERDVRIAVLVSIAIGIASVVYGSQRARLDRANLELKIQELARERAEKLAGEAQLASLAARLQPHFLFNTLNSISSLIRTDPVRAERLVGRFAALLRSSLDTREGDLVSLQRELKLVADYLEIQQVRYAHRLSYELDVPATLMEHRVPPFSIQTLVENSVKYAVAPSSTGSSVRVVASLRGAQLCLEVWDDGPGFSAEQVRANHGIDNLRERLGSIYAGAARLTIGRERFRGLGPEQTRVAVELPLHSEAAA